MVQAPAVDADELLSQLAASEIDRLLADADCKPKSAKTPAAESAALDSIAAATVEALAEGPERAALLEAAGFDSPNTPEASDGANGQPTGDERSALLRAAGFESSDSAPASEPAKAPAVAVPEDVDRPVPIYLKPLVWINAPLDACPPGARAILGNAALVTLVNALAVLAYLFFWRRH
ncbi:MAG: hypothetical protein ABSB74_08530 [Tepidisphaeraceae bacterium]